jgi:hypothetical protein
MIKSLHLLLPAFFLLILCEAAAAVDSIGIYWDTAYTQDTVDTDTFPSVHTGYVVLRDPSSALGVSGWECCIGIEGPAIFLSWVLEGQTLNLETPPCFQVAVSTPLPAGSGPVLLATFMTMVSEDLPVTYSVAPLPTPTLPGQMAYDPADDPGNLRSMISVTGNPEVAWINNDAAVLSVDRTRIQFEDTHADYPNTELVLVSNTGYNDAEIEVALADTSGMFTLTGPHGLVTIPARGSLAIEVTFIPTAAEYFTCNLSLGLLLPEVFCDGQGLVGTISWTMPDHLDFGVVRVGEYGRLDIDIFNDGQVPIPITPFLPDSCSVYDIWPATTPTTLGPGNSHRIPVSFEPTGEATFDCTLSLGDWLPDVTFTGEGCVACETWLAPTELGFAMVAVGHSFTRSFNVTNTGTTTFPLDPQMQTPCEDFTLIDGGGLTSLSPGQSVNISIIFSPLNEGEKTCILDLGPVVPPVDLQGTGHTGTLEWLAPSAVDFGPVPLANSRDEYFSVINIGPATFNIDVSLPDTCSEFELISQSGTIELQPGMPFYIFVRFTPTVLDTVNCLLDLGNIVPPVALSGSGREPQPNWRIVPPEFEAIAVGETDVGTLRVYNTGEIPLTVAPSLVDPCADFESWGTTWTIDPGASRGFYVAFTPTEAGSLSCILDLGDSLPAFTLTALGLEAFLDLTITAPVYETIGVGETANGYVQILNTGNVTVIVRPAFVNPTLHFDIRNSGGEISPGNDRPIRVEFRPTAPGSLSCVLGLGEGLPEVPLAGEAYPRPEGWSLSRESVEFDPLIVGDSDNTSVRLSNTGGTVLPIDVLLDPPNPNFSITGGGYKTSVLPGYSHTVYLQFAPQAVGADSTALVFGPPYQPVLLYGVGLDPLDQCLVQPDSLDFGSLAVGESATRIVSITNTLDLDFDISPVFDSPHFSVPPDGATLPPGHTVYLVVTFSPQATGDHEALLDLGNFSCLEVFCRGSALPGLQPDENLIGIFFDPGHSEFEYQTAASPELVTGYLVLANPTDPTGVAAWECAYDLAGNGTFLGWVFEGQALNLGEYNNLIVGIGGDPLPHGPTILLASFQILVPDPLSIQEFGLQPTQFPSLPDQMVWAPGGDPGVLLPMRPFTGQETVAWINKDVSAAENRIPRATALLPNVPNPFNPSTEIHFEMARPSRVSITVYDINGRAVTVLADGMFEAGSHFRVWRGKDRAGRQVPSGPYFVRMVAENHMDVQKILLLK